MSIWTSEAEMKAFAHHGTHGKLMARRHEWFAHFKNHSFALDYVPDRSQAKELWRSVQSAQ